MIKQSWDRIKLIRLGRKIWGIVGGGMGSGDEMVKNMKGIFKTKIQKPKKISKV